jgi:SRSO17 transposase
MLEFENSFLTGSALEALSKWSQVLKSFQTRLGQHFYRAEARNAASNYIQALLSPVERKNGWQMAEQVGHANPYRLQHLLGRAQWNADALKTEVRSYAVEHLGTQEVILAVDETGFIKQGEHSVGVQVQYCGLTGRLENCQVGVFLAYVSPHGHTLIDRRLYLPQSWAEEPDKRAKAGVPEAVKFATKPQLARQMLQSTFESGLRPAWVVADEVYGSDGKFWWWLEQEHHQPYLLTVGVQHSVVIGFQHYRAKYLAQSLEAEQWQQLSCGNGTKGERLYDWARIEVNCLNEHGLKRWLLFRRNLEHPNDPHSITYYQVYAPADTTLETMVSVAGQRWRIEECFTVAKDQLGLSEYEVRSWQGWHRHMTLVMAAQAFLNVLRHQIEPLPLTQKNFRVSETHPSSMAAFKAARVLLSP